MRMGRLLTWASLLLRGFPEDLRLLGAQRPQASQLLRQLRVGQRQVHPVGRRGRGRRAVEHFIVAWAQKAFLFLVTGFLSMEMNQRASLSAEESTMLKLKRSPAPLQRERGQRSAVANSGGIRRLFCVSSVPLVVLECLRSHWSTAVVSRLSQGPRQRALFPEARARLAASVAPLAMATHSPASCLIHPVSAAERCNRWHLSDKECRETLKIVIWDQTLLACAVTRGSVISGFSLS